MGPTVSTSSQTGNVPASGTTETPGRSPVTPHAAAGTRTEPPVSVPRARSTRPAATAAAEPLLDPPDTRSASHGLRVGPAAEFSPVRPSANSLRLSLATTCAPAAVSRVTTSASASGTRSAK
jgi:hypothetical protein